MRISFIRVFHLAIAASLAIVPELSAAQPSNVRRGDEVVVTTTRFPERFVDRPVNLTVITAEDIKNSAARTIPDLLSEQAGINVRDLFGNNASSTTVDLRGFGASGGQNTLILIDGRRVSDVDLSGVQWSSIPFAAIDRIEIVRGGGAVLYGEGASSGVINIITRSPAAGARTLSVAGRAASHDTFEGQVNANFGAGWGGINLTASNFASHGYRENNENRQSNALADLRWLTTTGGLVLKIASDRQGIRLPGARQVQPSAGVNQLETDRRGTSTPLDYSQRDGNQASLDWRRETAFGEFVIGAGYRDKKQVSYFDFGGFPNYRDANLDVWSFTPRVRVGLPILGLENTLVAGFDAYRWTYDLRTSVSQTAIAQPINTVNARQETKALYVYDTLRLQQSLTLAGGFRRERFKIDATDVFDPTAPGGAFGSGAPAAAQSEYVSAYELGVRYQWTPLVAVTAKFGRSYRFANVDETYETSTAFAQQFQFLRPQINRFTELSAEFRDRDRSLRATFFDIDVSDEIHLDVFTTGIGNTNLPPSQRRGFELEGRAKAGARASLSAAYTYTDARFESGALPGGAFTATNVLIAGKRVPLVPRHKANVGIGWTLGAKTRLNAAASYVSDQFMDNDEGNTFASRIPSYVVADLKLTHEWDAWRVSAAINNLFDRRYFNYAVRSQFVVDRYNAYPLPERTFSIALEHTFR